MIQTCEPKTRTSPARRRPAAPLPVLISIPDMARATRPSKARVYRRRLRREVRVAGYALLILLPLSMALATFAGERRPRQGSNLVVEQPVPRPVAVELQAPVSLSPLEPVVSTDQSLPRQADVPVVLPGFVIPVDAPEEPSDGGH